MISDEIEIITFREKRGHRIKMTSVHADYLLRELATGDSMVSSLEPHGTRITLAIREGVDFSKRSVEQILRYWVVLPVCYVEYNEHGKDSVRIGFDSPSQALEYYLGQRAREMGYQAWKTEVVSKHQILDGGSYEIAMAVYSDWFPQKSFLRLSLKDFPAVCLEGICVSEKFPGFESDRPNSMDVLAMVSVRGVSELRTTVSRYGLEDDDASLALGKACSNMMFEHVSDEVKRISMGKGSPLSRASTAGNWLSQDMRHIVGSKLLDHVNILRSKLPTLVIESTDHNKKNSSERKLVSFEELANTTHFWTIESRLVDSLGIISRDLGRELSLNEFLNALAPDLSELRYSPIVLDAHLFSEELLAAYHPVAVEFSRRHQQTVIQWETGGIKNIDHRQHFEEDQMFAEQVEVEYKKSK